MRWDYRDVLHVDLSLYNVYKKGGINRQAIIPKMYVIFEANTQRYSLYPATDVHSLLLEFPEV